MLPGTLRHQKARKRAKLLQYGRRVWGLYDGSEEARVDQAIEKTERLPTGVQKIRASIAFSPELCDIMSDYYFASSLAAKRAKRAKGKKGNQGIIIR